MYHLNRQRRHYYVQFADEESKNHLGPFARVLIVGPSWSLSSIRDSFLPNLALLPIEGSLIHYLSFKTAGHAKTYSPSFISGRQEKDYVWMCAVWMCVHASTRPHERICINKSVYGGDVND